MVQGEYTFGGLADSYYEYLVGLLVTHSSSVSEILMFVKEAWQIKQAQLTSFAIPQYAKMYQESIESAYQYLIRPVESIPGRENDLTTIGTMVRFTLCSSTTGEFATDHTQSRRSPRIGEVLD